MGFLPEHTLRHVVISILGLLALACQAAAWGESQSLANQAQSILGAEQGVYVEAADGTVLLAQSAAKPVHPASVSKVPTTLALLRKLGPEYRFVTTFATSGRVSEGTLHGDLLVEGGGDPAFVDENALLVADHLQELGITQVTGDLRLRGRLTFDWQSDEAGARLRRALAGTISPGALAAVRAFELENSTGPAPATLLPQGIRFLAAADPPQPASAARPLIVHRSQPLLSLAKSLNDYSNNIFKPLATRPGARPPSKAWPAVPCLSRCEAKSLSVMEPEQIRESAESTCRGESAARVG